MDLIKMWTQSIKMLMWCLNLKFFTRPQHRLEALFGHISKLRSTTGMCGFCFPPYVGYRLSVDGFNNKFCVHEIQNSRADGVHKIFKLNHQHNKNRVLTIGKGVSSDETIPNKPLLVFNSSALLDFSSCNLFVDWIMCLVIFLPTWEQAIAMGFVLQFFSLFVFFCNLFQ